MKTALAPVLAARGTHHAAAPVSHRAGGPPALAGDGGDAQDAFARLLASSAEIQGGPQVAARVDAAASQAADGGSPKDVAGKDDAAAGQEVSCTPAAFLPALPTNPPSAALANPPATVVPAGGPDVPTVEAAQPQSASRASPATAPMHAAAHGAGSGRVPAGDDNRGNAGFLVPAAPDAAAGRDDQANAMLAAHEPSAGDARVQTDPTRTLAAAGADAPAATAATVASPESAPAAATTPMPAWLPTQAMHRAPAAQAPMHSASLGCAPGDPTFVPGMATQIAFMGDAGLQQAQLQLHPLELGPIQVELTRHATGTDVMLLAAHAATRAELERAVPALRELLDANAGGAVAVSVSVAHEQAGADRQPARSWRDSEGATAAGLGGGRATGLPAGGAGSAASSPARGAIGATRLLDLYA